MNCLILLTLLCALVSTYASSIMGIDMGTQTFKIGLVSRGKPLEIVTNLHSKRKTETIILFDQGSRFYGADASSLQTRKPLQTPGMINVFLGRGMDHPGVVDVMGKSYPVKAEFNETRGGIDFTVKNAGVYTPEELMAMVISHGRDATRAYTSDGKSTLDPLPTDCVLTVPSFFTQHERSALLTAASLSGVNVLSLIDENTAACLHYGMDRVTPQGEEEIVMFYNLGATSLQVTLARYGSYVVKESGKNKTVGSFEVIGKGWDATLGGEAWDNVIVNYLADEFNKQWGKGDVREQPRAMVKLRVQAKKVKEVLSANTKIPIYIEGLHDDTDFKSSLTRVEFEDMCGGLFERAGKPVRKALNSAGITIDDVGSIELIGGGMRIPKVQEELKKEVNGLELGMHINSDESMALGAAFHGANISTAFRVRKVGMTDVGMFNVGVKVGELQVEESKGFLGLGGKKKKDKEDNEEEWGKRATIFKEMGRMGSKKTIAFTHDKDLNVEVMYEDGEHLPEGTERSIASYNITGVADFAAKMRKKGLAESGPKVTVTFELTGSGVVRIVKAEAVVEEKVEVEVEEEVEGEEEEEEEMKDDEKESKEGEDEDTKEENKEKKEEKEKEEEEENKSDKQKSEKKKKKKKKKTIKVMKEQTKTHKEPLTIVTYHTSIVAPYNAESMKESVDKLAALAEADRKRQELEEAKNKLESKVYSIKNYVEDNEEELDKVSTKEQREELVKLAGDTEEWLYDDGYDAGLEQFNDKYKELNTPAEKMFFRLAELTKRPLAVTKMKEKLEKTRNLMTKWETDRKWVTEEERNDVIEKIEKTEKWIEGKLEEQEKVEKYEDPAFRSAEVPLQTKGLEQLVMRLSKKPKPKPPKEEKKEDEVDPEGGENATAGKSEDVEELDDVKEKGEEKEEAKDGSEEYNGEEEGGEGKGEEGGDDEL